MNFSRLMSFMLLLGTQTIFSCGDEDDPSICVPANLKSSTDSIVFVYNASRKLDQISSYFGSLLLKEDNLEYDKKGRLVRVKRRVVAGGYDIVRENHELIYNNAGKPETLNSWGSNTALPPVVTTFLYDSKERLVKRETPFAGDKIVHRYEYDNNNNVIRVFYKNFDSPDEVLGREISSFDSKARFYAHMGDLEVLSVYILKYVPGKNNPLTATIYWDGPGASFVTPLNITYDNQYNESGLIVNSFIVTAFPVYEFSFFGLNYDCR